MWGCSRESCVHELNYSNSEMLVTHCVKPDHSITQRIAKLWKRYIKPNADVRISEPQFGHELVQLGDSVLITDISASPHHHKLDRTALLRVELQQPSKRLELEWMILLGPAVMSNTHGDVNKVNVRLSNSVPLAFLSPLSVAVFDGNDVALIQAR